MEQNCRMMEMLKHCYNCKKETYFRMDGVQWKCNKCSASVTLFLENDHLMPPPMNSLLKRFAKVKNEM